MRPSRLLTVMFLSLAVLIATPPSSSAQTVTALYSFTATGNSEYPFGVTPAQGRDGKLYGTSTGSTFGTVFTLRTSGAESDLFVFDNTDGAEPSASVTLGTDGNFYGTTTGGGSAGLGVLFKISPSGLYSVLHEFTGASDGLFPEAAPIQASDGNFYGTTEAANFVGATVYKLTPSGVFTTIDNFDNATAFGIVAPLVQGTDGSLYGTGYFGGTNNCGSIFKINTSGTPLRLFSFVCGNGGAYPVGLMQASDGNFYGTTQGSSSGNNSVVFKMDQKSKVTILHTFTGSKIGLAPSLKSAPPEIILDREMLELRDDLEPEPKARVIEEDADLYIVKAILERSNRKWEFKWHGVNISAPIKDPSFYDDFAKHNFMIAPGDEFQARIAIHQNRDDLSGVYSNTKYEVLHVYRHISRPKPGRLALPQ